MSLSDVDEKQFDIDGKWLKTVKELKTKITIWKTCNGQDVVLLNHKDYTNCTEMFFSYWKKFKRIDKHPTVMRLKIK